MKKYILYMALGFWGYSSCPLNAQTNTVETLEKGITEYNKLHQLSESLLDGTATNPNINEVETMVNDGGAQLEAVLSSPADSLHSIASYLKSNLIYDYIQVLFQSGDKIKANSLLLGIEKGMNKLAELSYPLVFEGNTKAITIQWSDFVPRLFQFNVQLGERYFIENQYDTALVFIRKARDLNDWDPQMMTANAGRLIQIKQAKNEYDEELLETALIMMTNISEMDADTRAIFPNYKDTPSDCSKIIEKILIETPDLSGNGEVWARTYRMLVNEGMDARSLNFAEQALSSNYKDKEFLLSVFPLAVKENRKDLARKVLDEYATMVNNDQCDNLALLSEHYTTLKEDVLALKYKRRAEQCKKNKVQEIKVAGRDGGLYLGTYVLPWLRTDWGVVAAIQSRKHLVEFSYQALTDRRDRLYDLRFRGVDGAADAKVRWDGYYTHVAISKIKGKKGGRTYNGLLFGYNLREYQPMVVNSITDENGAALNDKPITFKPKEQRYILMFNGGFHSYGRYLAADFYMGYGLSWNTFDRGNSDFDSKNYNYEGNPLLNGRKQGRIALVARVGVTIGLQIGPRTFEAKKAQKKSHS